MKITLSHISKSYSGRTVLEDVNLRFTSGNTYCLMSSSGSGKTTIFRLMLGLTAPDSGSIEGLHTGILTAVFQEDRLPEMFSPVEQLIMAGPKGYTGQDARKELLHLLPEECLNRPVSTLSGGMKRRVAICRALAYPFDCCLMDEPFTGLDEETRHTVITYVKTKVLGKLLIAATHHEEEAELLDAVCIHLKL